MIYDQYYNESIVLNKSPNKWSSSSKHTIIFIELELPNYHLESPKALFKYDVTYQDFMKKLLSKILRKEAKYLRKDFLLLHQEKISFHVGQIIYFNEVNKSHEIL